MQLINQSIVTSIGISSLSLVFFKLVQYYKRQRIPSAKQRLEKMSTEKEKMLKGQFYKSFDALLLQERFQARALVSEFNEKNLPQQQRDRLDILQQLLFFNESSPPLIEPPVQCDYGYNIQIGKNCLFKCNTIFIDCAQISFGDNCKISSNVSFYAGTHGTDLKSRQEGIEYALPIKIGNNVRIGPNVIVLPGICIGDNSIIEAGSIVTKNVEANKIVMGNPATIMKSLDF